MVNHSGSTGHRIGAIDAFAPYEYVVAPSGSCAGMLKLHYPELFHCDPNWLPRADAFAAKTYELTSFLVDVLGVTRVDAGLEATATYHDGCSGLRELGVRVQPRRLLGTVRGLTLEERPQRHAAQADAGARQEVSAVEPLCELQCVHGCHSLVIVSSRFRMTSAVVS